MPRTVTAGMGETSEHESILKQKFGAGDREAHQFVSRKLRGGSQLALPKMTTATAAKRTRRFILHLLWYVGEAATTIAVLREALR